MKQGKKPTRAQRQRIAEMGLNPEKWSVAKNLRDKLVLVHRETGTVKELPQAGKEG